MSHMRSRGISGGKIILAIASASIVAASLVLMLRPGLGTPHEYARVNNIAGFSIVAPLNWVSDLRSRRISATRSSDAIKLMPERTRGKESTIIVERIGPDPVAEPFAGFVDGTFQGQPARIFDGRRGELFTYVCLFQRGGLWYSLSLSTPDAPPNKLGESHWKPFMETFRVDFVPTTKPSTHQAP